MWIILLLIYEWQAQTPPDPIRSEQYIHLKNEATAQATEIRKQDYSRHHREEFEARFNKLVLALEHFVEEYRRGEGHTWPSDKAGEVKRAFDALQKTHAWKASTPSNK